jgi:hypothetical protein
VECDFHLSLFSSGRRQELQNTAKSHGRVALLPYKLQSLFCYFLDLFEAKFLDRASSGSTRLSEQQFSFNLFFFLRVFEENFSLFVRLDCPFAHFMGLS